MFGLFKKKLPHCDTLFKKYLSPWYDEANKPQMPRPDIFKIAAYEGKPIDLDAIQYLLPEILEQVKSFINENMKEATLIDFNEIYSTDELNLELLDAVDKCYNRKAIFDLINESDPNDYSNSYLVIVCEFGILLGNLFEQKEDYGWLYSYPYYHSIIVHKKTGIGIPVFDWAVKKFSEYGVDDGFVAKFNHAIIVVNNEMEKINSKNQK
jgi:hypothetical protein